MKTFTAVSIVFLALSTSSFAADAKAGGAAFDKSCKGCHGAAGAGNPAMAKMFPTMPDLSSAKIQGEADADLVKVVKEGKGKMPAAKALTASPEDVVAFVRTLKK
jgi:mono/diheme cytochrome c family protein